MYIIFDTETVGLPNNWNAPFSDLENWPRMVQIAWMIFDENKTLIKKVSKIIKPEGYIIPEEIAKIHRITTERAIKEGYDLKEVLLEFNKDVENNDYLIAHNIAFDEAIVSSEFLRKEMESNLDSVEKICTMKESRDFFKRRTGKEKWAKLTELYIELFGETFEDAHDALVDVKACAKCYFEMVDKGIIQKKIKKDILKNTQNSLF
ncbi:3'-5' exonuclease [Patescibacteria group bacterium]|nr:3'-5' exonuclease [Patescibacteria group bacterium]